MRLLSSSELLTVAGGNDVFCAYPLPIQDTSSRDYLIEELLRYKMGQPSLFGVNPDSQIVDPPLGG